jgi:hypothetical protein
MNKNKSTDVDILIDIANSLPKKPQEIPICIYPSLEEINKSAPDKGVLTDEDFI